MNFIIPKCINTGCLRNVVIRHITKSGTLSVKPECSNCHNNRRQGICLEGVKYLKVDTCQSTNCPVDKRFNFTTDLLHIDHIDGNNRNNEESNIQTLCSICHSIKGYLNGDFNGRKKNV
jgi:hypothetical protein